MNPLAKAFIYPGFGEDLAKVTEATLDFFYGRTSDDKYMLRIAVPADDIDAAMALERIAEKYVELIGCVPDGKSSV